MAHSLEGRFPFLDKELFDYVAGLPQGYKLHPRGTTKWLLKEAMSPYLPKVIIDRQKMGFTVPVDRLLDLLKSLIVDVFESLPRTGLAEVLNARLLRKHVEMYYQHRRILPLQLWTLFVMCYWHLHALPAYQAARDVISAQE
jgi:asparagine synthase (glutamine-hydrolysing)